MDKVILITGGAGGIGNETGARLAAAVGRVVVADIHLAHAQAKADDIVAAGGQALGVECDITSTNAEAAFPRRAAYCAAKAGVAMLTKVLAIEWAEKRIRVNAVGPAYVATEMTQRNIAAGNVNAAQIKARIPLGRLAEPADVADAVPFLLSEQAGFITGHSLYVDGGWLGYGYF